MEEAAYYELALLYASDIGEEVDYPLLEYAVVTTAIRWAIKGVSASFLDQSVQELAMANNITFNNELPKSSN